MNNKSIFHNEMWKQLNNNILMHFSFLLNYHTN